MSFRVMNCRVRVNFYFFALLCAAASFDRGGMMLWGLLAALLHECGHIAAMVTLPGQAPDEIRLTPFGIRIQSNPLSQLGKGSCPILAAGSAANFLCAAATFGFLPDFAAVSLVLGLLNLLPVGSMDGGGLLRLALERHLSEETASRVLHIISWSTLCGMMLLGIYVLTVTGYNFTLLGASAALAVRETKKDRRGRIL